MSNIERRMSASAQIIKQITIEGYYTSITFERSELKEENGDEFVEGDSQEIDNAGERQPIRIS